MVIRKRKVWCEVQHGYRARGPARIQGATSMDTRCEVQHGYKGLSTNRGLRYRVNTSPCPVGLAGAEWRRLTPRLPRRVVPTVLRGPDRADAKRATAPSTAVRSKRRPSSKRRIRVSGCGFGGSSFGLRGWRKVVVTRKHLRRTRQKRRGRGKTHALRARRSKEGRGRT